MKKVVILGHSHLGAIVAALHERSPPSVLEGEAQCLVHDVWRHNTSYADSAPSGGVLFNQDLLQTISHYTGDFRQAEYITLFGGNGHVLFGLARHPRPFDFVIPEQPDLSIESETEILPYRFVSQALLSLMMPYVWQLIAFRQSLGKSFLCVETPPPYGDDEYVKTHLGSYIADATNIVGRDLRLKLWRTHSGQLQAVCAANDVAFLPTPLDGSDGQFLHPAGYGVDATHANAWYGEKILQQIERKLGVQLRSWASFS